jgi:hypothetical protein
MSITVTLTWFEHELAAFCGVMRIVESLRMGLKHLDWSGDQNLNDIQSAGAEMAVAKVLNRYWCAGVNAFKDPDVGRNIEVRCTKYANGKLAIRERDNNDRPFVLVRGSLPTFEVVGWIYARDAKQEQWKNDPNGDGEVYMVPETALRSFPLKPNGEPTL